MYYAGAGAVQNFNEAMPWFRKAANQGNAKAQLYLGVMYAASQGVPQNFVLAHMWSSLARAKGNRQALKTLSLLAKYMTPPQIAEAQKLAREWVAKFKARRSSGRGRPRARRYPNSLCK
jgi:TPR repeat protein